MKDETAYCGKCRKDMLFEYIGPQETPKGDLQLYNCKKCHTTRAL